MAWISGPWTRRARRPRPRCATRWRRPASGPARTTTCMPTVGAGPGPGARRGVPGRERAGGVAYRAVLGRDAYNIPVTSIKGMIGQPFAAGGALQVVAGCFSLAEQFVPPTMNHDIPAPECDLDYVPGRGRPARVNRVLVTSRAIGPTHSAVVLGRLENN